MSDEMAPEPTAAAGPDEAVGPDPAVDPATPEPTATRRSRFARLRGAIHLPRSRRGLAALLLVFGGFGAVSVVGAASVIAWTETADFCGRCHQMGPELQGYEAGPHREVSCAECHVEPGVGGFIKAKINGSRQLLEVILGTFPTPIPPPDHDMLPGPEHSCMRCHSTTRLATSGVKTKTHYSEDEANTRNFVGLLIRPGGGDPFNQQRSVHWHVLQDVSFVSADEHNRVIDYVRVNRPDGTVDEFLSSDRALVPEDAAPDVAAVLKQGELREFDCLDCHNRVGHAIANPRVEMDRAMVEGHLDTSLPYLKREGMRLLTAEYPAVEAADAAIDGLRDFYAAKYPLVSQTKADKVEQAVTELKRLYRLAATPEMKVSARTYPDDLGHMDFPGCFRCHDGGHFKIIDGKVTNQPIPATCDACHTFPQLGTGVASLPFGAPPDTHNDRLFVFNHARVATGLDPGPQSCGECHARDYCANCHNTGAVYVTHDEMSFDHAKVTREAGNASCAYCHQPVYCARCHEEPVLPTGGALSTEGTRPASPAPSASPPGTPFPTPQGMRYPLRP